MSLAELLPAVRALTRDEKLELVRVVNDELGKDDLARLYPPGVEHHAGFGLYDEASCQAAAKMYEMMQERKGG